MKKWQKILQLCNSGKLFEGYIWVQFYLYTLLKQSGFDNFKYNV